MLKVFILQGSRHSSVDSSLPTILRPWVRFPSTPSTLFQFVLLKLLLRLEKNENKQKGAGIGRYFKSFHFTSFVGSNPTAAV